MENEREPRSSITRTINDSPSVSTRVREVKLSKFTTIFAGVTFIIMGAVAYITDLSPTGAIILGAMGIPGIIAGIKGSWVEKER